MINDTKLQIFGLDNSSLYELQQNRLYFVNFMGREKEN